MLAHLKSKNHFHFIAIKPYKFVVFSDFLSNWSWTLRFPDSLCLCVALSFGLFAIVFICVGLSICRLFLFVSLFLCFVCLFLCLFCSFVFFFLFLCFDDIVWWCRLRVLQTGWFTNSICSICGKFRFYSNIKRPKSHSLNQQLPPLETFRLFSYFVFRLSGVVLNFLLMSY